MIIIYTYTIMPLVLFYKLRKYINICLIIINIEQVLKYFFYFNYIDIIEYRMSTIPY